MLDSYIIRFRDNNSAFVPHCLPFEEFKIDHVTQSGLYKAKTACSTAGLPDLPELLGQNLPAEVTGIFLILTLLLSPINLKQGTLFLYSDKRVKFSFFSKFPFFKEAASLSNYFTVSRESSHGAVLIYGQWISFCVQ